MTDDRNRSRTIPSPSGELIWLRLNVQRMATLTQDSAVWSRIPASIYEERGWNLLCAELCEWIKRTKDPEAPF